MGQERGKVMTMKVFVIQIVHAPTASPFLQIGTLFETRLWDGI